MERPGGRYRGRMTDELAQGVAEAATGDGRSAVEEASPATATGATNLSDLALYFNRELSWLDFNDRVLQLAEDSRVPLLERLNFCAIYEDNLDEFYMVRVAGLHDKVEGKIDARGADGLPPDEVIDLVRGRA